MKERSVFLDVSVFTAFLEVIIERNFLIGIVCHGFCTSAQLRTLTFSNRVALVKERSVFLDRSGYISLEPFLGDLEEFPCWNHNPPQFL